MLPSLGGQAARLHRNNVGDSVIVECLGDSE